MQRFLGEEEGKDWQEDESLRLGTQYQLINDFNVDFSLFPIIFKVTPPIHKKEYMILQLLPFNLNLLTK